MKATKPILTSDQVNYLIWRYLQEIGNGDAARYLQRDWTEQSPDDLPFARHVHHHALVLLLQKGLLYHELEMTTSFTARCTTSLDDGSRVGFDPSMYFFGPESGPTHSPAAAKGESNSNAESGGTDQAPAKPPASDPSNGRKHARESMVIDHNNTNAHGPNGISSLLTNLNNTQRKRPRRSANGSQQNGSSRPPSRASSAADPMEIDQNGYGRAAVGSSDHQALASSPVGGDGSVDADGDMGMTMSSTMPVKSSSMRLSSMGPATGVGAGVSEPTFHDQERIASPQSPEPAPLSITNGRSWGVVAPGQPAKVAELGPETTILGHAAAAGAVANNNHVAGDHPQHVTQTLWHPRDPCQLATIGNDFCRTWQLSSRRKQEHVEAPSHNDLIAPSEGKKVTAVAWDTLGEKLAVAVFESLTNQVAIHNGQGAIVDVLSGAQGYVNHLVWRKNGAQLFGIMAGEDDTSLVLWDMSDATEVSRSNVTVRGAYMHDASWTSSDVIYTCGENTVWRFRAGVEISIEPSVKSLEEEHNWSFIKCSDTSMETIAATADDAESPTIWLPTHDIYMHDVHHAQISGLEFGADLNGPDQPIKSLATASLDGTIKVWSIDLDSKHYHCLHRLPMVNEMPVLASSLSPDGCFIAAASEDNIRIWNMERGGAHVADWDGRGTGWKANEERAMTNGDTNGQVQHAAYMLSWDCDSKKLAFGLKDQVAVIDFQR